MRDDRGHGNVRDSVLCNGYIMILHVLQVVTTFDEHWR